MVIWKIACTMQLARRICSHGSTSCHRGFTRFNGLPTFHIAIPRRMNKPFTPRPPQFKIPPGIREIAHLHGGQAFKAVAIVSLCLIAINSLGDLLHRLNSKEDSRSR